MKDIQKKFMEEFNEPITKIGLFNSERNKDVTCQVQIWNDKYINWLETKLSERKTITEVSKQTDSKALHIADVSGLLTAFEKWKEKYPLVNLESAEWQLERFLSSL